MRSRRVWGPVLAALGALIALLGLAIMAVLGPDGRFSTGPHAIDTDHAAVVTAPSVVRWAAVQVDVLVEVPIRKPVFVGVGNTIDVENYLANAGRIEITSYDTPWAIETRDVEGEPNVPSAPTALDWWIASQAGLGGASVSLTLPDEPVSIAVVAVGSTNLKGLEVTLAYGVKGGFGRGAGLALLGLGLAWAGLIVRRGRLWRERDDSVAAAEDRTEFEEVEVYVWVDEHGVEHEISPDELDEFEVVDADTGTDAGTSDVSGTAAPTDASDDPIIYVWVDEDGVEHEISADELDEFEIVDEEDER